MTAYTFNMPSGIAGDVSRSEHAIVEAALLSATVLPIAYGVPVKTASGKIQGITTGDTIAYPYAGANVLVTGFLVRAYPTNSAQDALGAQTMPTSGIVDVMKKGYMMVHVGFNAASCAKDGLVYVRVANNSVGHSSTTTYPPGQIEGTADTTAADTLAIPRCFFTGAADAQGFCEISFNIIG